MWTFFRWIADMLRRFFNSFFPPPKVPIEVQIIADIPYKGNSTEEILSDYKHTIDTIFSYKKEFTDDIIRENSRAIRIFERFKRRGGVFTYHLFLQPFTKEYQCFRKDILQKLQDCFLLINESRQTLLKITEASLRSEINTHCINEGHPFVEVVNDFFSLIQDVRENVRKIDLYIDNIYLGYNDLIIIDHNAPFLSEEERLQEGQHEREMVNSVKTFQI